VVVEAGLRGPGFPPTEATEEKAATVA